MPITDQQERVLTTLRKQACPMTAYRLLEKLRGDGLNAPTQIYRALEQLSRRGLVHRLESMNAFISCCHEKGCQHEIRAFAICDHCGHVTEFASDDLGRWVKQWTKDNTFTLRTSTIELHGLCESCGGVSTAENCRCNE